LGVNWQQNRDRLAIVSMAKTAWSKPMFIFHENAKALHFDAFFYQFRCIDKPMFMDVLMYGS
jgi:hypothetical protein